jgi:hypothetical protein
MAFIRRTGSERVSVQFPKVASVALNVGDALIADGSGAVTVATATSTAIIGICQKKVASTDADYASNTMMPVEVIDFNAIYEADVDNTLTTAMVGLRRDLTDKDSVNATGTTHNQVTIVGYISATKALVMFNSAFQAVNAA